MRIAVKKKPSPAAAKKEKEPVLDRLYRAILEKLSAFFKIKTVAVATGILFTSAGIWGILANGVDRAIILVIVFVTFYWKYLRHKKQPGFLNLAIIFALTVFVSNGPYAESVTTLVGAPGEFSVFLQPFLILVVLMHILYADVELSFLYLFFVCLLNSFFVDYSDKVMLFFVYFITSFTALISCLNVRRRFDMMRAGIIAGFVQGLLIIIYSAASDHLMYVDALIAGTVNGLLSMVVVIGVSGIFEFLFSQITNISLLELSDFNHPLLRKMILEAPGTYQHSLVVANLSEAAAEAIGANSLLARVGSYYHDIGKLSKAEYFSENQMLAAYRDRHKKLSPSMSTLIIMNHVKEGIELARKYHLNQRIIDFIAQHHGTTLVYYFFAKAQQQQKRTETDPEEEVFRYPGPKPQSKEVAIVHLADTIEARSRTLEDPTPSRIKEMVKESIIKKFLDGQFDDTDITLKDLETISAVFARMINASFHMRVEYPKAQEKNKGPNGNNGPQQSENKNDQSAEG